MDFSGLPAGFPPMATIIGIGGMSRAGKTHLARRIQRYFGIERCAVVSMDAFVFDVDEIPKINGYPNWEIPESIDYSGLIAQVVKLASSFNYVVVEGLLIFHDEGLNTLFDERVLLEIERPLFLERRKKEKRWGPESMEYLDIVWNEYQRLRSVSLNRGAQLYSGKEPSKKAFQFLTGK